MFELFFNEVVLVLDYDRPPFGWTALTQTILNAIVFW
jgi:hypothetical protein